MYQSYKNIIAHLAAILGTAYGWIIAMASWTFNFLAPAGYPFAVVFILVIIDLIWGIIVALKLGTFVYSEALRETCTKLAIYGSCLVSVYLIEQLFYSGIAATSVSAGLAGTCEIFSFSASILIIKPNFPFISLFRNQLQGEMAKKLGQPLSGLK